MSAPFTPGPWHVGDQVRDPFYITSPSGVVASSLVGYAADRNEAQANARLIAAAPDFADIAARAQYLANELGGDYDALSRDQLCSFMVEFDAALAKARGDA